MDIARGQFDRRLNGAVGILHLVMALKARLQAEQDLDRLIAGRLRNIDLLEAPNQGAIFLEIVAVFLVGGRAYTAESAALEGRLQKVGGVQRSAAGGACADHGVDLVDEENRALIGFEFREHGL